MLELIDIKKDYEVAGGKVSALKGVSMKFRSSEFVSILGPSGCGKTTLLNIIGGLDKYTSGDLVIAGRSTKEFKDGDWDTYRNHSIGFIFQSYHLIPHQTILQNVELALTISGVEKEERRRRAIEALEKVGLGDKLKNKPNQLSGGQAQRVAIARALINDPEIVLADEPTGALDSKTSVQIMELLKEIARERLVIMVTHNPELAEQYSTRIISLKDGEIIGDTDPFDGVYKGKAAPAKADEAAPQEKQKTNKGRKKKSSMSIPMAFMLSLKNLLSKFKRTAMVSFAGSIGIIGVSMVLAISAGVQLYIKDMENDMLAGYPIQITEDAWDISSMMSSMTQGEQAEAIEIEDGKINVDFMVEYLYERGEQMNNLTVSNEISQEYVDYVKAMPNDYYAAIDFDYNIDVSNNIYTDFKFTNHEAVMSLSAAKTIYTAILERTDFADYASFITTLADSFNQMPDNPEFILSQYEFLTSADKSKVATEEDEITLVVNSKHELSDLLLAQLGYYTQEEFFNIVYKVAGKDKYDSSLDKKQFDYDELLDKTFTWYPNDTVYNKTDSSSILAARNPFTYNAYADDGWTTGKPLKITGILIRKENQNYGCLSSGFYYTSKLTQVILEDSANSQIVRYILDPIEEAKNNPDLDPDELPDYITSMPNVTMPGIPYPVNLGITYYYEYNFEGVEYNAVGFVGTRSTLMEAIGSWFGQAIPATYTITLRELGGVAIPNVISVYPTDFNYKDNVTEYLDAWNKSGTITVGDVTLAADDRVEIIYTDIVGLIINMINTMIKMITVALVAFTALSLVVSTVMVGIITYVSVVERIKEIGILRAVGARKKDIKRLFIAETFIIGLAAGVVGIGVTYLISGILNLALGIEFGIYSIAALPVWQALIMVGVSVGLTLISGLIPASAAAKKDPVVALRTE